MWRLAIIKYWGAKGYENQSVDNHSYEAYNGGTSEFNGAQVLDILDSVVL